jgi:hypothetical protein
MLYETLCGKPPYSGSGADEVIEQAAVARPPSLRSRDPGAPAALESICRKAMAKSPADRYASAEEVATEVRRWLDDEPVAAHPERWPARFARWTRRRRTLATAAAVLLLTAAIGSTIAATLIWREQRETSKQRQFASDNADAATQVVRDLSGYADVVEFGGRQAEVKDADRLKMLAAATGSYERLVELKPDDRTLRWNAARINRHRANLLRLTNAAEEAESVYRRCLAHVGALREADPKNRSVRMLEVEAGRDFGHGSSARRRRTENRFRRNRTKRNTGECWRTF